MKKTADQDVFVLDSQEVPLLRLAERLGINNSSDAPENILVVIVEAGDEKLGLIVDKIIEASEVIIKPVPTMIKNNNLFSGTTILGDGKAALIINTMELI
jgi:two-component system chemotaxis sensor kinase CheA